MNEVKVLSMVGEEYKDVMNDVASDFGVTLRSRPTEYEGMFNIYLIGEADTTEETLMLINEIDDRFEELVEDNYSETEENSMNTLDRVTDGVMEEVLTTYHDMKNTFRQMRNTFRMLWNTNRRLLVTATVIEGCFWLLVYVFLDWLF